jgi:DNA-binding NtrC family response regulator
MLQRDNIALKVSLNPPSPAFDKGLTIGGLTFIAKNKRMKRIIDIINSISTSDCNVLISGESGVGKGLVAKLIHYTSLRKDRPFLAINCSNSATYLVFG